MQTIKGLFFDLDGTLCDSLLADFSAYQRAFADEGHKLAEEDFRPIWGMRADKFIPLFIPGISEQDVKRIREHKARHYADTVQMVEPNLPLVALLHQMKAQNTIVIVTTARQINASKMLKVAGLSDVYDHIVFGDDVVHPKPHPEAYLKALELSGLRPEEVIAFEDSGSGVKAAAAAGVKVIKVAPAHEV